MGMDVATQDTVVMPGTDDATLARAAQAGDPAGLGGLFERHRAHLYAVALGILGHGPDADDAVQDTIVIAMSKIGALRDPGAAGGWLVAILVNVCRARLRRPVREVVYTEAAEASGALDTVQETVERGALRDWVWSATASDRDAASLLDCQLVLRHRRPLRRSHRDGTQPAQCGASSAR